MFDVNHIKSKTDNYLEMYNEDRSAYAKIDLKSGGSLQDLFLNKHKIISSKETLPYETSFASAILFPFANRIADGRYSFNNQTYQLKINKEEENNAIHGLVYDKTFKLVHSIAYKDFSEVHVRYIENKEVTGFPFKYILTISYILTKGNLKMNVEVKNIDSFSFPFTLGWHPYFVSSDLAKSVLDFDCSKKKILNDKNIPIGEEKFKLSGGLKIDENDFDDCFILDKSKICLHTPDYRMDFNFSHDKTYLQLYTPSNRKTIAIEPQTGAANSFNDNRGLKVLHPRESFEVCWSIDVE